MSGVWTTGKNHALLAELPLSQTTILSFWGAIDLELLEEALFSALEQVDRPATWWRSHLCHRPWQRYNERVTMRPPCESSPPATVVVGYPKIPE